MSPLKKRAKRAAEEEDTSAAVVATPTPTVVEDLDTFFEDLLGKLLLQSTDNNNNNNDNNNNGEDKKSFLVSSLFTLKTWQHDLLQRLQVSEKALGQAHQKRERQERTLLSLEYEKRHLDAELETCRNFEMKHLKQLASEEAADTTTTTEEGQGKDVDDDAATEQQLKTFLQANVHDPNARQHIVQRLHQELNSRGSLERDLKWKQQELEQLEQELEKQSNFLQALPDHLASLERASLPLQKFMLTKQPPLSLPDDDEGITTTTTTKLFHNCATMIGTERQQRIELAQTLPPPLYTLFQQLQHYLDQPVVVPTDQEKRKKSSSTTQEEEQQKKKIALCVISGNGAETTAAEMKQVVLQLSVPDVLSFSSSSSSGRLNKVVSIHFYYNSTFGLVTAIPRGCSNTLNQDILLDQLFPNDHPSSLPGTTTSSSSAAAAAAVVGRPYHWCNYLAGLHLVPDVPATTTTTTQNASTRVILRELQRRIRANATLKHILYSLHRNHVPTPPGLISGVSGTTTTSTWKLIKFGMETDQHSNEQEKSLQTRFHVTLAKGGEVTVSVSLNLTTYPREIPQWTLMSASASDAATPSSSSSSQTKLYDDRLAALENYVNASGLEDLLSSFPKCTTAAATTTSDDDDNDNDERAYEWILVLQLRHILQFLSDEDGVDNLTGSRKFKGRDHAPL